MPGANETLSRINIDAQLKDQGCDVLDTNSVRFEERCRSVLGIVAQKSEALRRVGAVVESLLACTFNSNQVTEGAKEEVAFT